MTTPLIVLAIVLALLLHICECFRYYRKGYEEAMEKFEDKEDISASREYVIVSPKHSNFPFSGALVYWGHLSADNEKRSFGGYTFNLDKCERYTLKEVLDKRKDLYLYHGESYREMFQHENVIIKVSELFAIEDLQKATMVYRQ